MIGRLPRLGNRARLRIVEPRDVEHRIRSPIRIRRHRTAIARGITITSQRHPNRRRRPSRRIRLRHRDRRRGDCRATLVRTDVTIGGCGLRASTPRWSTSPTGVPAHTVGWSPASSASLFAPSARVLVVPGASESKRAEIRGRAAEAVRCLYRRRTFPRCRGCSGRSRSRRPCNPRRWRSSSR